MKKMLLLLAIAMLGIGGCGQVDLSGFHDLAGTMQSVQPHPAPSSADAADAALRPPAGAGASPVLANHASSGTLPIEIP